MMRLRQLLNGPVVGVQAKTIVITTFLVLATATMGGYLYFVSAGAMLRQSDQQHAQGQGHSLSLMVAKPLAASDATAVRRIVLDLARSPQLRYVAVVDAQGRLVAAASRTGEADIWGGLVNVPPAIMACDSPTTDVITISRPVLNGRTDRADQVVGGVRLVFDARATAVRLARLERRLLMIAAAMVVAMVPLGYLMVWRVMVQPLRRMVGTVRRVAQGDFDARTDLRRNDETGELAGAMDTMIQEIGQSRLRLMRTNEELEVRIAQRTAQLRLANDRLRQEMVEKEEFLRVVSHDLSAPLRNIAGMASTLLSRHREQLPPDAVSRLGRIQANIDSEMGLIGELLEFSRLKTRLDRRESVDVAALLEELAEVLEYDLKNRSICLRVRGRMPVILAERTSIKKVFQNLIDNAIKYMDKTSEGLIEIGYQDEGELMHLTVSDNGPGVPQQDRERVFCIFRRVENAQTAHIPGKGIGLAMVRTVATHYGGNAWVGSAPGRGAVFHLTLGPTCREVSSSGGPGASSVGDGTPQQTLAPAATN
jgi:signal transduction histidine kinase